MKLKVAFASAFVRTSDIYNGEVGLLIKQLGDVYNVKIVDLSALHDNDSLTNEYQNSVITALTGFDSVVLDCSANPKFNYGWVVETVVELLGTSVCVIAKNGSSATEITKGATLLRVDLHTFDYFEEYSEVSRLITHRIKSFPKLQEIK
ncbi:hypothetical protein COB64_00205 [Candidatus Wolfebacteria bacterium]|nr:MAG: hypothetical protein COB64_00205 [Candidatus Wolfebacteria bacterium]